MCFPDLQTLEDANVKQTNVPFNGSRMYPQQADSKSQWQQKFFETLTRKWWQVPLLQTRCKKLCTSLFLFLAFFFDFKNAYEGQSIF